MHWGIRRYQPYTSNPRKGGKTGKFVGDKPKAKIVKDSKESVGLAIAGGAILGGSLVAKAVSKIKQKKNEKRNQEELNKEKEKAKEGMDYLKTSRPPDAARDISNAGAKVHEAIKEYDDWTNKIREEAKKHRAPDGSYTVSMPTSEIRKREGKINKAIDTYKKTLQKWDFDMDGETEYSRAFYEECHRNRSINNSKSGAVKDSKSGLWDQALKAVLSEDDANNAIDSINKAKSAVADSFKKQHEANKKTYADTFNFVKKSMGIKEDEPEKKDLSPSKWKNTSDLEDDYKWKQTVHDENVYRSRERKNMYKERAQELRDEGPGARGRLGTAEDYDRKYQEVKKERDAIDSSSRKQASDAYYKWKDEEKSNEDLWKKYRLRRK